MNNLKQVASAIQSINKEFVVIEIPNGIGIAFKANEGVIRCEFDEARQLTGIFVDKNMDNYKIIKE